MALAIRLIARRRQEAALLPHRRRRQPRAARRPLHREGRHLQSAAGEGFARAREARRRPHLALAGVGAQPSDRVLRFLDAAGIRERAARNNPKKAEPGEKAKERVEAARRQGSRGRRSCCRAAAGRGRSRRRRGSRGRDRRADGRGRSGRRRGCRADSAGRRGSGRRSSGRGAAAEEAAAEEAPVAEEAPAEEAAAEQPDATDEGKSRPSRPKAPTTCRRRPRIRPSLPRRAPRSGESGDRGRRRRA